MKIWIPLACFAVAASAAAQDTKESLSHARSKYVAADTKAPVSQSEARNSFLRAEQLLVKVTGARPAKPVSIKAANQPVSREQVVNEMFRLYSAVRLVSRSTPVAVKSDIKRLRIAKASLSSLTTLVKAGAVAPYGTLAVGPKNTLSIQEFGDALGFFIARMAQLTNMPNRQWTPGLMDPAGG